MTRRAAALACAACAAALSGGLPHRAHAQAADAPFTPDGALLQQVESLARSGAAQATPRAASAAANPPDNAAAGADRKGPRVEVKVGKLDPRLRLAPCSRIEPYLPAGLPFWGATRVGLKCTQGPKAWNVSIPVTVSVYARATVVTAPLPAGTVLEAGQLAQAEVDLAAAPGAAVTQPELALGRTLSRNLAAGATLRQTDLKTRQWFAPGDTVRILAGGPGWQVVSEGQAMSAGIEGQLVRVRTEGGRPVSARPTGDHQVELAL